MARALFIAAALVAGPVLAQGPAPFRAAVVGPPAPCAAPAATAPAATRAWAAHMAARLKRPVQVCSFADTAAAGAALASGGADMALLDAAGFAPHQATVRAILAGRPATGPGRVLSVLMARGADARATVPQFSQGRVVLAGTGPVMQDGPVQALTQAGLAARPAPAASLDTAMATLRAGRADAALLDAGSVTRACRGDDPESRPCRDLKEIWRGRPRAPLAWAVRRDMPEALRFQIIGIQIAVHQEAPAGLPFAIAGMTGAAMLEPAESLALTDPSQTVRSW